MFIPAKPLNSLSWIRKVFALLWPPAVVSCPSWEKKKNFVFLCLLTGLITQQPSVQPPQDNWLSTISFLWMRGFSWTPQNSVATGPWVPFLWWSRSWTCVTWPRWSFTYSWVCWPITACVTDTVLPRQSSWWEELNNTYTVLSSWAVSAEVGFRLVMEVEVWTLLIGG